MKIKVLWWMGDKFCQVCFSNVIENNCMPFLLSDSPTAKLPIHPCLPIQSLATSVASALCAWPSGLR